MNEETKIYTGDTEPSVTLVEVEKSILELEMITKTIQISRDMDAMTKLFADLAKFQNEVKNPVNNKINPFFKSEYAPLDEVLNSIRPILSKYGLAIMQPSTNIDGGMVAVSSLVTHKEGGFILFAPLEIKPNKNDAQGIGGAITYGRRYQLSAIMGVSSEEDDDGGAGSTNPKSDKKTPNKKEALKIDPKLKKAIGEIDKLAKDLSKDNRDSVLKAIKENNDNVINYKNITDLKVANKVLTALKELEPKGDE